MAKKIKEKKTIGEMTQSRGTWGIDPTTRVVESKKGKGSYRRKENKNAAKKDYSKFYD